MKRICFRLAIARTDVGFDYYGGWVAYNPCSVLENARRELKNSPGSLLRLQYSDEKGKEVDLGWNADWLRLLDGHHESYFSKSYWNRHAVATLLAHLG